MTRRRSFGSVRKLPSGRFQARYTGPDGQERKASRTFATKTEASKFLAGVEADLFRGDWYDIRRGEMPMSEVAERWYSSKAHLRQSTRAIYRTTLDIHILPFFGDRAVASVTTLDVQEWLSDRRANSRLCDNSVAKAYKIRRFGFQRGVTVARRFQSGPPA